jgi:hypothetical protein
MRKANEVAMNCRGIRDGLNEALAAGRVEALEHGTALHLEACGECRDYYNAQSKLYVAIDSGVRKLVEDDAPPSLLPAVRERLAAAAPNRGWVGALVPSTVALLIICGMLLLLQSHSHRTNEKEVASVQPSLHQDRSSTAPEEGESKGSESELVVSNRHPVTRHEGILNAARSSNAMARVIFDRQESRSFGHLVNEIGKNPELGLTMLHPAALPADQEKVIESLNIAKLGIPTLAEENR